MWMAAIPMAGEREAILLALQKHNLITVLEPMIEITEKGARVLAVACSTAALPKPKELLT